ncbi:MAG: Mitochondrial ATPase complex subunit atp10 [Thelocarpon impressellum]|nr:MAG: Mitochondrial ATPase complex subunit atp10 [Thelocarpon impressellum]
MSRAQPPLFGLRFFRQGPCTSCQRRNLRTSAIRHAGKESSSPASAPPREAGLDSSKNDDEHVPRPLSRPIGLPHPPKSGENTGIDPRTWQQRRDDFLNWDKHLERRKQLTKQVAKPYFREWSDMRFHAGKTFLAPPSLFRSTRALYFPNLRGRTLSSPAPADTTPLLTGKISVVSVYSGTWAQHQAETFTASHPALDATLARSPGAAQRVDINVEENALRAAVVRLFLPGLRRRIPRPAWDAYFLVRRGLVEGGVRDALAMANSKVGYVFLVDGACRVRWAGSGRAEAGEREGLVRGVRRLVEEHGTATGGEGAAPPPVSAAAPLSA